MSSCVCSKSICRCGMAKVILPSAKCKLAFELNNCEQGLFDSIAKEHIDIAGTDLVFYSQDVDMAIRDALYDEPIERVWKKYNVKGWVEWPNSVPEMRPEGLKLVWEPKAWISRLSIEEAGAPAPQEGDVVRFWDIPIINDASQLHVDADPKAGYYFDVVDVDHDGHVMDTAGFVGYALSLVRRTEYTPERRLQA